VAEVKRGGFSTCAAPRPGRRRTVTTPEIIDQIHEVILEDCQISATSIAEQLGISRRERFGSIIHEHLEMWKLSAKWVPKCLIDASRLSKFWIFFGGIQLSSSSDLWPWTKPGYITMIRRQSNNQWSGGIAAHLAQITECKNSLHNSRLDFLGSRRHPPYCLSSKGPNSQRGLLLISAGATEGHFERKTPR